MSATAPLIESVRYFACGHCVNHLQRIFRHHPKQKRVFQAGVFLIKHRVHGHILYDTGYGTALNRFYWKYLIYRAINPTYVRTEDTIAARLAAEGIAAQEIDTVIVSHLHPDHIGGLKSFPHARLLLTQGCWDTYRENRFRSLIFPEFLPDDFEQRAQIVPINGVQTAFPYAETADLFGDGSLFLAALDGHAKGQGCLFVPEYKIFLAADVCWGQDVLALTDQMRRIPRLIQDDFAAYRANTALLQTIQSDGIRVLVSHDTPEYIGGIL
jgi:hypothetical protein